MERPKLIGVVALSAVLGCGLFSATHTRRVVASAGQLVQTKRVSRRDLAVRGLASSMEHGYIPYESLLHLPQVTAKVEHDASFTDMHVLSVKITGVPLSALSKALQVPAEKDLLLARSDDGYVGIYPAEYVAAHEPILVLTVDSMTTAAWAQKTGNVELGPYLIGYDNFKPAWHVLAHEDRPQALSVVLELEYKTQQQVFGPIIPAARFGADSPERAGFAIAKQSCLRCHAAGPYGGTKAGLSWEVLAGLAKRDGATFAQYVHDPKSISSKAKMPANPQYDAATLQALTAYYSSMVKQ
ncbi:MAG: hypothetical protein JWM43_844 [Acidobacteriaceae bacterium]|nr:hypothetical protein [Acidobacteriaceae bacterium]